MHAPLFRRPVPRSFTGNIPAKRIESPLKLLKSDFEMKSEYDRNKETKSVKARRDEQNLISDASLAEI